MSEMLLVAIFAGATEGTTSMVLAHRRRHLLSAGDVPSPRIAAASCSHSQPGPTSYAMASRSAPITQLARSARCPRRLGRSLTRSDQNAEDFALFVERDKGARLLSFLQNLPSARELAIAAAPRAGWYLIASRTIEHASIVAKFAGEQAANPGPLTAEIDSFDLGTTTKEIRKIFADFDDYKEYVKAHQGVRVYRDGFEVRMPDDWVGLGKTWTSGKSYYGLRPSNTLGFVAVTAEHNNSLTEKSDREGFVDSPSSRMFRAIVESFVEFCNQLLHVARRGAVTFLADRKSEKANLKPQWSPKDAVKELEEIAASSRVKKVISAAEIPVSLRKQAQIALDEADKAIQEWEKTREELRSRARIT